MKHKVFAASAILMMLGFGASRSFASAPNASLQDVQANFNGSVDDLDNDLMFPNFAAGDTFNDSSFNYGAGVGTITLTFNPGVACNSCFVNILLDEEVGTDFYNEFGAVVGALPVGDSYEIAGLTNSTGAIYTDAAHGTLTDKNTITSTSGNGDVAIALGYTFSLTATQEEVITINASTTAPGGFYLQQTNPADGLATGGTQVSNVYFSLSAATDPTGTVPPPPPGPTPEPSSWILLITGLGAGATQMRRRFSFAGKKVMAMAAVLVVALMAAPLAKAQSVNTVPWDPTNLAAPHTAFAGANIVLGAIFNKAGSADSFSYVWNFGDGSAVTTPVALTTPNDISVRHVYSKESDGVTAPTIGYTWNATVTVTDTTTNAQYTGTYLVIWEDVNKLQSRVNVAIDLGLWHLHQAMYHATATTGTWTSCNPGYQYGCGGDGYGSMDATAVQAFEVNGHLGTGPATDPYTSDVAEGMTSMLAHLTSTTPLARTYYYNPAAANFGCSDGTAPTTTNQGTAGSPNYCAGTATEVFYNASATSCTAPPCTFTFDGNANNKVVYTPQYNSFGYEQGMYVDALVASTTPAASGTVAGNPESYKDIVQDIIDWTAYCQYGYNYDVPQGYTRGSGSQGGAWIYGCQGGTDNSVSQWAAIGMIGGQRGFGLTVPTIVTDANNMWVTSSQDVQDAKPIAANPWATGQDYGSFGYDSRSSIWGPFASTPSGMVQMSLDGVGRTKNTVFGDATSDPDQRFNSVESWYADNFCNDPTTGAYYAPRDYTYGLFSFTKAMLLHNPKGALSPIQYLRTATPNVFTGNASIPANTIDWYAATASSHYGGSDACDGVAQTIVGRQNADGSWNGHYYSGEQDSYEPAWDLIMLQRTVFVNCVNNLAGQGTMGNSRTPARIDLNWTGIPNVTGYNILISSTNGGPYSQVAYGGGTTTNTVFSDRSGLTNGQTYYFVLQPTNAAGVVCQSNQASIVVP